MQINANKYLRVVTKRPQAIPIMLFSKSPLEVFYGIRNKLGNISETQ